MAWLISVARDGPGAVISGSPLLEGPAALLPFGDCEPGVPEVVGGAELQPKSMLTITSAQPDA